MRRTSCHSVNFAPRGRPCATRRTSRHATDLALRGAEIAVPGVAGKARLLPPSCWGTLVVSHCSLTQPFHTLALHMKPEKQTTHFRGRIITVTTDEVVLPNGYRAELEVVHHPGGAAVVAIDAQERVCLLRQYRYVADGW